MLLESFVKVKKTLSYYLFYNKIPDPSKNVASDTERNEKKAKL